MRPYSPLPPLTEIAGGATVLRKHVPLEYNISPNIKNQLLRSGKVVIDKKEGNSNHYLLISLLYEAIQLKEQFPMRGMEINWDLIHQDYELLVANEPVIREGIIHPEPDNPDDAPPEEDVISMGNMLLEEQMEFLKGVNVSKNVAERARNASILGKAMSDLVKSTEYKLKVMRDAGQLVDVREVESLIRLCVEDMLKEVMDLPSSYAEQLAEDLDCDIQVSKKALDSVSNYLGGVVQLSLDRIGRETLAFIESKAKARRKGKK